MIYKLQTDEGDIAVNIIRSKRKTLGLEVKYDGTVNARVPLRVPRRIIEQFIQEQQEWIIRSRKKEPITMDSSKILPPVETKEGKAKIRHIIEERTAYYADIMGVTYHRITMRNQKTRWGSCSSQGNLNFNNRLLFIPEDLVDYVIVHELAHRKEMNHSKAFWNIVERYLPDYRERRAHLREYHIGE